ncbi:MAG: SH3 domain-containing protein [Rhizobiaceae bacterium]|nr:SH3 domain-containing protein [Rhizobiaceae bacterium]
MRTTVTAVSLFLCASAALAYSGDAYEVCRLNPNGDNFLALRAGPSSQHAMTMKLGPGSVVEARGGEGKWMLVVVEIANGKTYLRDLPTGYVYTDYLCKI